MSIIDIMLGGLLLVVIVLLIMLIRKASINSKQLNELDLLREAISRSEQEIRGEVKSNQENISNTLTNHFKYTYESFQKQF